jgi:hypothetical protein
MIYAQQCLCVVIEEQKETATWDFHIQKEKKYFGKMKTRRKRNFVF